MGGPSNTIGVKDITIYPFELRYDIIKVRGTWFACSLLLLL